MGREHRKPRQRSLGRAFCAWKPLAGAGALLALLLALLLVTPSVVQAKETLVPAQVNQLRRTDQRGFNWDPNVQGIINDGTSDCFDNAMALKVNSGHFTPNKPPMQTKDGQEFIFRGTVGQIEVTRRLRLDPVVGAMRYVEILKNTSRRAVRVTVETSSMLGSNASGVQTNLGRSLMSGQLQKGETALFAIHNGGSRPSVIFQLRGPRSKNVPIVNIANNRTFTVTWNVNIPAGRSAAVLHSVAQRRWAGTPAAKAMETELKPMLDPKWAHSLPGAVRSVLVNHGGAGAGSGSLTEAAPAHAEVLALAKAYQVERGEEAVVLLDREKPLTGSVEGTQVQVKTRMGDVSVPFDDVAVMVGGAGLGRSMRLYLRDGEILAGHLSAAGLRFKTKSGLEIPLETEGLDALFLPKQKKKDGVVAKDTDAFLTQLDGTKLALKKSEGLVLHAVSPWGDLEIPLKEAIRIRYTREPLPGLWILLQDGSRFPLAVRGAALPLTSRRFGDVDVVPGSIAAWTRHGVVARVIKGEDEDEALPATTHAQFLGGCFLAGTFLDEEFTIETVAGATTVRVEKIANIERSDDGEGSSPTFLFKLKTGDSIEGRIRQPLFRWKTPRGTCRVPTLHLWGYRWTPEPKPEPEPDKKPADDPGESAVGKDAAGKDAAGKDAAGKDAAGKDATPKDAADAPPTKGAGKGTAPKKAATKKAPAKGAPPKNAQPKSTPAKESK